MRLRAAFQSVGAGRPPSRFVTRRLPIAALALTMFLGMSLAGRAQPAHAASCPPGDYEHFNVFILECRQAEPGHFANGENQFLCTPGTYAPGFGFAACPLAEPGYFVPNQGSTIGDPVRFRPLEPHWRRRLHRIAARDL